MSEEKKWKEDEMKQFRKLVKGKMCLLKKEAATALEPELRRIVKAHKDKVEKFQDEKDMELKLLSQTLQCEAETRFKQEKESFDEEEEKLLAKIDRENEQKMRRIKKDHLEMLDGMRTTHKENMKLNESAFRSKKVSLKLEHESQISKAKVSNEIEIQKVTASLKSDLNEVIERNQKELKSLEEQFERYVLQLSAVNQSSVSYAIFLRELSDWKTSAIGQIEKELEEEQKQKVENIKRKAEEDVKVIASKLESEFQQKKAAILRQNEKSIDVSILSFLTPIIKYLWIQNIDKHFT